MNDSRRRIPLPLHETWEMACRTLARFPMATTTYDELNLNAAANIGLYMLPVGPWQSYMQVEVNVRTTVEGFSTIDLHTLQGPLNLKGLALIAVPIFCLIAVVASFLTVGLIHRVPFPSVIIGIDVVAFLGLPMLFEVLTIQRRDHVWKNFDRTFWESFEKVGLSTVAVVDLPWAGFQKDAITEAARKTLKERRWLVGSGVLVSLLVVLFVVSLPIGLGPGMIVALPLIVAAAWAALTLTTIPMLDFPWEQYRLSTLGLGAVRVQLVYLPGILILTLSTFVDSWGQLIAVLVVFGIPGIIVWGVIIEICFGWFPADLYSSQLIDGRVPTEDINRLDGNLANEELRNKLSIVLWGVLTIQSVAVVGIYAWFVVDLVTYTTSGLALGPLTDWLRYVDSWSGIGGSRAAASVGIIVASIALRPSIVQIRNHIRWITGIRRDNADSKSRNGPTVNSFPWSAAHRWKEILRSSEIDDVSIDLRGNLGQPGLSRCKIQKDEFVIKVSADSYLMAKKSEDEAEAFIARLAHELGHARDQRGSSLSLLATYLTFWAPHYLALTFDSISAELRADEQAVKLMGGDPKALIWALSTDLERKQAANESPAYPLEIRSLDRWWPLDEMIGTSDKTGKNKEKEAFSFWSIWEMTKWSLFEGNAMYHHPDVQTRLRLLKSRNEGSSTSE